jgi:hypothetical protein
MMSSFKKSVRILRNKVVAMGHGGRRTRACYELGGVVGELTGVGRQILL